MAKKIFNVATTTVPAKKRNGEESGAGRNARSSSGNRDLGDLYNLLSLKLDSEIFDDLFEKVNIGSEENPRYAIEAKYGLYSVDSLSAKGLNPGTGELPTGSTTLAGLTDVDLSGLTPGQSLVWNGTKWVNRLVSSGGLDYTQLSEYLTANNYAKKTDIPSLTGYATEQWVKDRNYLTSVAWGDVTGKPAWIGANKPTYAFSELSSHPTTLAGYGITDAITAATANASFVTALGIKDDSLTWTKNGKTEEITIPFASAATRLSDITDKTAWGQTFFSGGQPQSISGNMTNVGTIGFMVGTRLQSSADHAGFGNGSWTTLIGFHTKYLYANSNGSDSGYNSAYALHVNGAGYISGLLTANGGLTIPATASLKIGDATITWDATNKGLHISGGGLYSDSYISAKGVNTSGGSGTGSGGGGVSYSRLDNWGDYLPESQTWVLSAKLGYDLHTRLNTATNNIAGLQGSLGDYLLRSGGSMTNTNVVTNLNADLLDGLHSTSLFRKFFTNADYNFSDNNNNNGLYYVHEEQAPSNAGINYGGLLNLSVDAFSGQFRMSSNGSIAYRSRWWSGGGNNWIDWKTIAFTDSNVASATRLQGSYTIWGQTFYGNNVSGNMTGVGSITFNPGDSNRQLTINTSGTLLLRAGDGGWAWGLLSRKKDGTTNIGYSVGAYGTNDTLNYYFYGGTYDVPFAVISPAGNMGIGTTSPSYKLHVNGTFGSSGNATVPRINIVGTVNSSGYITADNANNITLNVGDRYLTVWSGSENAVRPGNNYSNIFSLGTATARWSNIYATTINVTSTNLVSNLNADMLDGLNSSDFQRNNSRAYTSVSAFPSSGTEGWYDLFTMNDDRYGTAICSIKAYAHTSMTFIVGKGYSTSYTLQILQYCSSANASHFYIKGVRILSDGRVQGLFNTSPSGVIVSVSINIFTAYGNLFPNATLTLETGSPTVLSSLSGTNNSITSNIKFNTARTLWGQSFDGSGNVTGNLSSVGSITPLANATYLNGSATNNWSVVHTNQVHSNSTLYLQSAALTSILFMMNGTECARFCQPNGYLGLGTTTPSYRFHSVSDIFVQGWLRTSGSVGWFSDTYGGGIYMTDSTWVRVYNGKGFYVGGTAGIYFNNGAGTAKLYGVDYRGDGWGASSICLQTNIGGTDPRDGVISYPGLTHLLLQPRGGYVGIATTSASYQLHVGGVIFSTVGIFSNGYVSAKGQDTSSDERLKQDFKPLNLSLAEIANAPSITFRWKKDGSRDFGTVAQYWQRINPLFARTNPEGDLTIDYGKIAHTAIVNVAKKTMNHEERIQALERENRELKKQIAELKRA